MRPANCTCCRKDGAAPAPAPATVYYEPVYPAVATAGFGFSVPWWVWALLVIMIVRVK